MIIMAFLFTGYHEAVINCGGLLGGIALVLTFTELYKANKQRLFGLGLIGLILSGFNYFVYKTGILLFTLASMQKLTFLVIFVWASLINIDLYRKEAAGTYAVS